MFNHSQKKNPIQSIEKKKEKAPPWRYQRELKKQDVPTHEEMELIAGRIPDLRTRALFCLTYLSAGRMGEIVQSMQVKDFVMTEKRGRKIALITLFNEKNRTRKLKKIPIPVERDRTMLNYFIEYYNTLKDSEEYVFPFGYAWAWKLLRKYVGWNPHWFRHIRITHLYETYEMTDSQVMLLTGWTDPRPSKDYVHLKWGDVLKNPDRY